MLIFALLVVGIIIWTKPSRRIEHMEKVETDADFKNAIQYAIKKTCEDLKYTPVITADGWDCKHNADSCKAHRVYHPSVPADALKYIEWRPAEKKCVVSDANYRKRCEDSQLTYDEGTGKCSTNEPYCESKFVAWRDGDCFIPPAQKITEGVLGTTVGRALAIASPLSYLERLIYKN